MFQSFKKLFIGKARPLFYAIGSITGGFFSFKGIEFYNIKKIKDDPEHFTKIPPFFMTEKTCLSALEKSNDLFEKIPKDVLTDDIYCRAIENYPKLLWKISYYLRTNRMYETAVNKDHSMLTYFSAPCLSKKLIEEIVDENPDKFFILPCDLQTEHLSKKLIEKDANYFCRMPYWTKTEVISNMALDKNIDLFQLVPEHVQTSEMCKKVIKQKPEMFKYISKEKKTDELIELCAKETDNLDVFNSLTMTGKKFKELFPNKKFVKLTGIKMDSNGNEIEANNDFVFKTGLNIDTEPFNDKCFCCKGGLYFTEEKLETKWSKAFGYQMKYVRPVTIPDDALVAIEYEKVKADKIILGERNVSKDYNPSYKYYE